MEDGGDNMVLQYTDERYRQYDVEGDRASFDITHNPFKLGRSATSVELLLLILLQLARRFFLVGCHYGVGSCVCEYCWDTVMCILVVGMQAQASCFMTKNT